VTGGAEAEPHAPQPEQGEPTFEEAQAELERIVERLEQGQTPLEEALRLWTRGEELYAFCRAKLDAAEGKVEELVRRAEQSRPPAGDAGSAGDGERLAP